MFARVNFAKLSLMDALDLAVLIENEAYERYAMFSEQLGHRYPGDAGSVFKGMAVNEKKHGDDLRERRKKMFGEKPTKVNKDDLYDVEAPEVGAPRYNMSPLKAFQLALESEQKAFGFYERALVHIVDPDVKKLFEELRDEEVEHVAMVKKAIEGLPPEAREDVVNADED